MIRQLAFILLAACVLVNPSLSASADEPARRPNILFVMLDDLGKDWVSCYGGGCRPHRNPSGTTKTLVIRSDLEAHSRTTKS